MLTGAASVPASPISTPDASGSARVSITGFGVTGNAHSLTKMIDVADGCVIGGTLYGPQARRYVGELKGFLSGHAGGCPARTETDVVVGLAEFIRVDSVAAK